MLTVAQTRFRKVREAKEFLASKIVDQADREGASLSEIERKMLFFTEVGWTLPDMMQVSDEFDREYDQADYEKKIAHLIENLDKRLRKENPAEYEDWRSAIEFLGPKDHYINVMIAEANLRPPWDRLKLFTAAVLVVVGLLIWTFISQKYGLDRYFPDNFGKNLGLLIYGSMIALAVLSVLVTYLFYLFKSNRTPRFLDKILSKLFADQVPAKDD
jgi:hypothetical protein